MINTIEVTFGANGIDRIMCVSSVLWIRVGQEGVFAEFLSILRDHL